MRVFLALIGLLLASPSFAATCWISEYRTLGRDANGNLIEAPQEPPVTNPQAITSIDESTTSAAFNAATHFVGIYCDIFVHYRFSRSAGDDASTLFMPIPAATLRYFPIERAPVGQTQDLKVEFCDDDCT